MKRKRLRGLLIVCAALLFGAMGLRLTASPVSAAAEFDLVAGVLICSELPEFGPYQASPLCTFETPNDMDIVFSDDQGNTSTCTVGQHPQCGFNVPFSSTTIVRLDEADIPAGYYLYSDNPQTFTAPDGPPDGVVSLPLFVLLPIDPAVDTYGIGGAVAYCDADPRAQGNNWLDICSAATGVHMTFSDEQGAIFDECDTQAGVIEGGGDAGVCGTQVPLGSTTTVAIDEATADSDYALISDNPQEMTLPATRPDGILGMPIFIFVAEATNENPPVDNDDDTGDVEVSPGQVIPGMSALPVVLYTGDCGNLGSEVATLSSVQPESGDPVGDANAVPAAMSVTIGAGFFLDEAIDGGYALVVYSDASMSTAAACGEMGGINNHDGLLPIGLASMGESELTGVATFSYNANDETTTDVTVYLTQSVGLNS